MELGYTFNDPALLELATVHSSRSFEEGRSPVMNNERLEFLGDAVLDLVVGASLYEAYPEMREGELSRLRAALVNEGHLAGMALEIGLDAILQLGRGEEMTGGRGKPSILANAFEALIGAVYLDGGFGAAEALVRRLFLPWLEPYRKDMLLLVDAKSNLQEKLQGRYGEAPAYVLEKEEGPDHDKLFSISVRFRERVLGVGVAKSKKEAEQRAAVEALQRLGEDEH